MSGKFDLLSECRKHGLHDGSLKEQLIAKAADEIELQRKSIEHFSRCECPIGAHEVNLKYCTNCGAHCLKESSP